MCVAILLACMLVSSMLFFYGDKMLQLSNEVDIYHALTGQPIDADCSDTDECSESSSSEAE